MKENLKILDESKLVSVNKPTRYTGHEVNQIVKEPTSVEVRMAFAFPDVYDIGMSHLGSKILYHVVNQLDWAAMERVYAPWPDYEALLRREGAVLTSLENRTPLCDFPIVGFTLQYELTYSNIFLPINTISNRIHYFYDFTHKSSYAGIFDEHITYSWDENYTLSTSLLLSGTPNYLISDSFLALVQDKIMSIYNYNGENIQSLFTGDIRFICETQNEAGKGQLFFSYCLLLNDNDVMEFYFYLYSIPTEEFIKL